MPGPSGESCVKCYFAERSIAATQENAGFCHRYPPIHHEKSHDFQPMVDYECDWCGEFRPLKPEGTE